MDQEALKWFHCITCTSCGVTVAGWSGSSRNWGHSHNLPKGLFSEFEVDPDNISPRCQDDLCYKGCHEALDRSDFKTIKKFKDLEDIMAYRKKVAPGEYNIFVTGLREVGCMDYDFVEFTK